MKSIFKALASALALSLLAACGGGGGDEGASRNVVVLFGDSLADNNGRFVTPTEHWTEKLKAQRTDSTIVVSAVGGETTVRALQRLPSVLAAHRPTHIVLMHGTNDLWRECQGCYKATQENLEKMAAIARGQGVTVIFGEMTFKRFGGAVAGAYSNIYQSAASNTGSRHVNMVAGVPYDRANYHPDMVHFNNGAQTALKDSVVNAF